MLRRRLLVLALLYMRLRYILVSALRAVATLQWGDNLSRHAAVASAVRIVLVELTVLLFGVFLSEGNFSREVLTCMQKELHQKGWLPI